MCKNNVYPLCSIIFSLPSWFFARASFLKSTKHYNPGKFSGFHLACLTIVCVITQGENLEDLKTVKWLEIVFGCVNIYKS